jgi:hypothetical protein
VGQRLIAAVVVAASACTALQLSTTSQEMVVVSNNPYTYPGPGMQSFTVSAATSGDDDSLQSITFNNCNSQWLLMLNTSDTLPTRICSGLGSGGSALADTSDGVFLCPHSYTFSVGFSATQSGLSSCNVDIVTVPTAGGSASTTVLMLSGSGSGGSGISVSPGMIDFQDVQINTTSTPSPVTVKNNGTVGTSVTMSISGTGFAMNPPAGGYSLGPGSAMNFDVTCHPTGTGLLSGMVQASGGASIGMTTLSCNGINSTVTINPTQVTFAPTLVDKAPPNQSVMITGGGSGATLDTVSLDAVAQGNGVSLVTNPVGQPIGGGLTIVLGYSAAAEHQPGPLGTLTIQVSSDSGPRNIGISGTALLGGIGTNPASVEFGAVCAGSKAQKDVEVYASEAGDITLTSLTKPAAPFDATSNDSLPHSLMGNHNGASVTVKTSMMPAMPGEFTDKLVLNTDIPMMGMTNIAMHGIALAGGIAATPNLVHFGSVMTGQTTSVETVQLTNCGTTDLMFTGAHITGASATEFTLIGSNPARTLKPTESEIFMIVMQPQTTGAKVAQLVIEHSAGTTTADLDGTATGGSNKDRETYYACSTGRGAAAWPVALAVFALRRRRRAR